MSKSLFRRTRWAPPATPWSDEVKDEDGNYSADLIKEKAKVLFVGLGIGVGEGEDVQEAHFYSGALSGNAPRYQAGDYNHMVGISAIRCLNSFSAGDNNDCVMLHYYPDKTPNFEHDKKSGAEAYTECVTCVLS